MQLNCLLCNAAAISLLLHWSQSLCLRWVIRSSTTAAVVGVVALAIAVAVAIARLAFLGFLHRHKCKVILLVNTSQQGTLVYAIV
jgi:uncharacterized membrane protein